VTRIEAVLFDWGDTLFESPHAPTVILEHARAQNIPMTRDTADQMWRELWDAGKTAEEHAKGRDLSSEAHRRVWTDLFSRANPQLPGIDRALYEQVMDASTWTPYPDTEATLRALHDRRVPIGIISNHSFELRDFFKRHRLDRYIDSYTLSYQVGAAKPSPRIFEEARRKLAVPPANVLMVGDDAVSDGGASAVGLQVYLLPPYEHGGPRGLERIVQIVDASRA
jgi:HAD superfamily hydrolase (TIGR01493 family)